MKRLYNEHMALNQEGLALDNEAYRMAKDLLSVCKNEDVDLRDAESVAINAIHALFSEAILKLSMEVRKVKEKTAAKVEPMAIKDVERWRYKGTQWVSFDDMPKEFETITLGHFEALVAGKWRKCRGSYDSADGVRIWIEKAAEGCPNCDGTGRDSCPLCDGTNKPFPEEEEREE